MFGVGNKKRPATLQQGRFPANILLDESAAEMLDEQSGHLKAGGSVSGGEPSKPAKNTYGEYDRKEWSSHKDSGGASRFFYCAKASKSERNAGLEGMPIKNNNVHDNPNRMFSAESDVEMDKSTRLGNQNHHPTVKPIKLMEYLTRLITPPGGTILDPFMGSGTTGIACNSGGFEFIGIELNEDYFKIAQGRTQQP